MNEHSFIEVDGMPGAVSRRLSSSPRLVPGADKRDAILQAATHVFARRGFFQSQVADIARVAGVAAGTVYLYFRSKDDLLVSIFDRTMREALAEGREALAGVADARERLRRIARLHLERLGRDRDLAVVFQVELRQSTKFMERFSSTLLRDYLEMIRTTIADGQQQGVFRSEISATTAAKVFFGALDEMATNWILTRRRYALAHDADAVVDLFVHGVAAPRAAARTRPARQARAVGSRGLAAS
jgi:TetR/AcrR family fatty acid metabolism transcriptional regulator